LKETEATLAVVGTHGHSRLSEILIGGVAGELLRNAPCSICLRPPAGAPAVVRPGGPAGVDGSPQSAAAAAAARYLAERFAVPLSLTRVWWTAANARP
jgi:hypothetical protein